MDVFKGQMTLEVLTILNNNNMCLVNIPPNMTKYYQPLDLMVNGHAKRYLKNKFSTWYGNQISKKLDEVVNIDAVNVKLRLTALKPLHAQWIVDFYNEMTTVKRKPIIESGWRAAGITDAIRIGSKNLPAIDPFHDIDPLIDGNTAECQQLKAICGLTFAEKQIGYSRTVDDDSDDSDWERSAFDALNKMDE